MGSLFQTSQKVRTLRKAYSENQIQSLATMSRYVLAAFGTAVATDYLLSDQRKKPLVLREHSEELHFKMASEAKKRFRRSLQKLRERGFKLDDESEDTVQSDETPRQARLRWNCQILKLKDMLSTPTDAYVPSKRGELPIAEPHGPSLAQKCALVGIGFGIGFAGMRCQMN